MNSIDEYYNMNKDALVNYSLNQIYFVDSLGFSFQHLLINSLGIFSCAFNTPRNEKTNRKINEMIQYIKKKHRASFVCVSIVLSLEELVDRRKKVLEQNQRIYKVQGPNKYIYIL